MKNKYPLPLIDLFFNQLIGAQVLAIIKSRSVKKISQRLLSLLDMVFMSIW
jgi:hypothetical protein